MSGFQYSVIVHININQGASICFSLPGLPQELTEAHCYFLKN